jgi:hypothetical protein
VPEEAKLALLFAAVAAVLYGYGVMLLRRMGTILQQRSGAPMPRIVSPYCGGDMVRAYRDVYEASDGKLPRLHRSIGLNRVLFVVVVVAGVVRMVL